MNRDLSRKQFLSLGVLGGLGLLGSCALDENSPKVGSGGSAGSSGSTSTTAGSGGTGGGVSTTTSSGSVGTGGSGGTPSTSTGGGVAGNGGASSTGGSAGSGGSTGGSAGTGGSGGSKDGGAGAKDAGGVDAGACKADPAAAISLNHNEPNNGPHFLTIPMADIAAGVETVYRTVSGANPPYQSHIHAIKLTPADFAMLRAGMTVTKKSCDGHEHQYAIRCGTMAGVPAGKACTASDFCGSESNPC